MDEGSPTLEVGFAIDHGASFGSLTTLDDLIGDTAANAVREFQRMENASKESISLGGATAEVRAFGNATTREMQTAARETARVEKAGDALSRQLGRQISTFGMSRAAAQALRSEQAGLTEQSQRLQAQEAALARLNTQAALQQQAKAARERAAAEQVLNSQLAERAQLQAAIERTTGAGRVSATDAGASFSALAARAAEEEARAVREAAAAHQMFEARVRQGVIAMREQAAATAIDVRAKEQLAIAAERLRASIDPSAAAQQRFNREMAEARTLVSAGVISLDEYVAKLRLEQTALDATRDVMGRHTSGAVANRMAMQGASYQVQDFFTQVSMGANPINAFAVQGAQLAGQFSNVEGKAGNVARFFMGPWGLAITAGLMVLGPLVGKLLESNNALDDAVDKLKKDASATETNRLAKEAFVRTLEGVIDAVKRQNEEFEKSIQTQRDLAIQGSITARVRQADYERDTRALAGQLEAAKTAAQVARDLAGMPGADPTASAMSVARAEGEVTRLTAALKAAKDQADAVARSVHQADTEIARNAAKTATDKIGAINAAFDQQVADTTRAAVATAKSQEDITVALTKQLTQIEINRQAAVKAEQDKLDAAKKTAEGIALFKSREQAIGLAGREFQGAGLRVDGNVQFGVTGGHNNNAAHNRYAIDVNVGNGITEADVPNLKERFDKLARLYQSRGYDVIWNKQFYAAGGNGPGSEARGHRDHMHVQAPASIVGKATQSSTARQQLGEQTKHLNDLQREYDAAVKAAEGYADAQTKVAREAGMSAKEIRLYTDAAAIAKAPTEALKQAIRDAAEAREKSISVQSDKDFQTNVMQPLRDELALYGLVGPARDLAALALEKEGFMAQQVGVDLSVATARWQEYYNAKKGLIDKDAAAQSQAEAQRAATDALEETIRAAERAGDAFARAFGRGGAAVADMIDVVAEYASEQRKLDVLVANGDIKRGAAARKAGQLQITAYGDMISSAKGFFSEKSKGYKAMEAAEKVYRAFQLAMSLRSMVQDMAETISSVTNSGARAVAQGAEGVATQSKLPFPLNIAAMAATAAALVAAGIAVMSGGGGKSSLPASNTGTGTVLGDGQAKSESITNAINALKDVDTVMLSYSRQMAASLRSIESQIGGFASLLVRQGDSINATGDTRLGFKPNIVGSVLGSIPIIGGILGSLFGSKTTVVGNGLFGGAQSLDAILAGGFDADYYTDLKKKSKFFGISTGTKYSTKYSEADPELENQFTLILRSFNDAILAAAGPLGASTTDIANRLKGFVVNIGKIDLKDLTGDEIAEKLNAVFGAAADDMAKAAFPGMEKFQQVGEGMFETLVRVASTVETVTSTLDMLGTSTVAMSLAAKMGLADQFESVSDLTSAADAYFQSFYTKEEQAAARTAQMAKAFDSLNFTMPNTLAGVRALVEAQDLTSEAGRAAYATLLQLAPAFADLQAAMDGAKSAADIISERQDLQRQLLELNGDTAALRAMQLAKLDASNRALQEQIYAVQDAQAAAKAAEELRNAWTSVGDSIMTEVKRIRGLSDTGGGGFASLLGQFNAATSAARAGDIDAAKSLPQLSQALLAAAQDAATSRQELDRIRAQTAASLEATNSLIAALNGASTATAAALLEAGADSQATGSTANDNSTASLAEQITGLREELAAMRADNNAGHAATAGNTGKTAAILDRASQQSGGDAITVEIAA